MLQTTKNYITYPFSVSNTVKYVLIRLYVETEVYSNTYKLVDEWEAAPDENGDGRFYLQEYLDKRLSHDIPNWNGNAIQNCLQVCKRYKLSYTQVLENSVYEELEWTDDTNIHFALLGGFSHIDFPYKDLQILPNNRQFLTTLPYLVMDLLQQAFVAYMPFADAVDVNCVVNIRYSDNTTATKNIFIGDVLQYQPVLIPISEAAQGYTLLNPSKKIVQLTLVIDLQVLDIQVLDNEYLHYRNELHFSNSLGGFDSLQLTGIAEQNLEADKDIFEHYLPYNYTLNHRKVNTYNHSQKQTGKLRSGFLEKSYYEKIVEELLVSKEVFLRIDQNRFLPINITTKKMKTLVSDDFLYSFEFDYVIAF
jgi:hypothetical protein